MDKKRILMIDDEEDFSKLVKKNLESMGNFEIIIANNAKAGIKQAKRLKPDLILLDINMPKMDGFEALRILKEDSGTMPIPVVMLSARADDESKIRASQLYDEHYITKPIDAMGLKIEIERVLIRKRSL